MDEDKELKIWAALFTTYMILGFKQGVKLFATTMSPEDLFTAHTLHAIRSMSFRHAAVTLKTTEDDLRKLVTEAAKEGQSIQELAKGIDKMYGDKMGYRSKRIARTEMTQAVNEGAVRVLKAEGVTHKEWRTLVDGRERDSHRAAHGQIVPMELPFILEDYGGGGGTCMMPGADSLPPGEKINCRCNVVNAKAPKYSKEVLDVLFLRTHGSLERNFMVQLRRAFQEQRIRVLSHFPS